MTTAEPSGLVLAGGRSHRMGREKAFIPLDGPGSPSLIERQVTLLKECGVDRVLVSLRRDLSYRDSRVTVVHDDADVVGPLAGIVTAMRKLPSERLVVLAVDMPGVTRSILNQLMALAARGAWGAAPKVTDRWEPLCAVYPPGALEVAEALLERSRRTSPSRLLDALDERGLIRTWDVPAGLAGPLESWNRPEDVPPAGAAVS